jgi:hypothetical protein
MSATSDDFSIPTMTFNPYGWTPPSWCWEGTTDPAPDPGDDYWNVWTCFDCENRLWNLTGYLLHAFTQGGTSYQCYYEFDYSFPCIRPDFITLDGGGHFQGTMVLPANEATQKLGHVFTCPNADPYNKEVTFTFN